MIIKLPRCNANFCPLVRDRTKGVLQTILQRFIRSFRNIKNGRVIGIDFVNKAQLRKGVCLCLYVFSIRRLLLHCAKAAAVVSTLAGVGLGGRWQSEPVFVFGSLYFVFFVGIVFESNIRYHLSGYILNFVH